MVLKMRPDQDRISLGLRQILPDPWAEVPGKYTLGEKLKVIVSRVVQFGAFVTLSEGIEAIIPNSELSLKRINRPTDVVNQGDEVEAIIIELKPDERKMTLSIRRIQEQERRETDAASREQEYQEFRNSGVDGAGAARSEGRGGREKRGRREGGGGGGDFNQGGRVTLGDIFGEQLGRARKEVSRKGRPGRSTGDDDDEDEE
jgi:4-hydroxy-3-methylbut-2-enyl diphosphate reductase